MTDFDKIRAILDAATPGPWEWRYGSLYPPKAQPGAEPVELGEGAAFYGIWPILSGENAEADARAIVVSRNLAPAWQAVAEAAETFVTLTDDLARWDELNRYVINSERDYLAGNVAAARERLDAALDALHAKMKETL